MLLTIDIGNTNITLGIFDNGKLVKIFNTPTDKTLNADNYKELFLSILADYKITGCSIGSVVKSLSPIIKDACDKAFGIDSFLLSSYKNINMDISLSNPSEVGADRIENAIAALLNYRLPAIVVDIGTATTFDIVAKNGHFVGGVIMPGINMQLESLNIHTSELPKIKAKIPEKAIGNSTENAILSGVIKGISYAIKGLLIECENELGEKPTVIATGGYGEMIAKCIPECFDYINPTLTLDGLRLLFEREKINKPNTQK